MLLHKHTLLQFIPTALEIYVKEKTITFKNKKLKTSYLADICHFFITKWYFKDQESINLHSSILRSKYGTWYNYYMEWLQEKGFLTILTKYFVGKKSCTWRMPKMHLNANVKRYINSDKVIIKKWIRNNMEWKLEEISNIDIDWLKRKLIQDLEFVELDFESAMQELDRELEIGLIDQRSYVKNVMCIEAIHDKSIFWTWDEYGRLHTNFTVLKRTLRNNFITINGEQIAELDIKNSQPYFLSMLMEKELIDDDEFKEWKNIVYSGKVYETLSEGNDLSRSDSKRMMYKVLFGRNYSDKWNIMFAERWPKIYEWIKKTKEKSGLYASLAHELQKMESSVVFEMICAKIKRQYPHIKIFTVHDSIFFPARYHDLISSVFYEYVDLATY